MAGDSAVRLPLSAPIRGERSGAVYVITRNLTYRPGNSSSKRNSSRNSSRNSRMSRRNSRRSHSSMEKPPCRSADLLTGLLGCMVAVLCYKVTKLVAVVGRWREPRGRSNLDCAPQAPLHPGYAGLPICQPCNNPVFGLERTARLCWLMKYVCNKSGHNGNKSPQDKKSHNAWIRKHNYAERDKYCGSSYSY